MYLPAMHMIITIYMPIYIGMMIDRVFSLKVYFEDMVHML